MGDVAERDMGLESGLECVAVVYQAVGSGGEAIAGDGGLDWRTGKDKRLAA